MARAELVNRFVLNKLSRAEVARPQRKKEVTSVHGGLKKLRAAVNRLPGGLNAFCGPHVLRSFATSRQELNREQGPLEFQAVQVIRGRSHAAQPPWLVPRAFATKAGLCLMALHGPIDILQRSVCFGMLWKCWLLEVVLAAGIDCCRL